MEIRRVAVIGAGVMGAKIAAHLANADVETLLLDIVPHDAENRNVLADKAIDDMLKSVPATFVHPNKKKLVISGNLEDDFDSLKYVDWIIEAIVENLEIKQSLYKRIEAVCKSNVIVSSNTSTIPLEQLAGGSSEGFRKNLLITHFFNPPRYMRLLELVAGADTDSNVLSVIEQFCDKRLGKGIVYCNDTPGFIANRIGIFWMQSSLVAALDHGVTVEEADAVLSAPSIGIPKTGIFGLFDLVGVDLHPKVDVSMAALLEQGDAYHTWRRDWQMLNKMIEAGYVGRKGKGGFYRIERSNGTKIKQAMDLQTGEYAPVKKAELDSLSIAKVHGLTGLVAHADRGGRYAWTVLSHMMVYAASLLGDAADDIVAIDRAMTLGYNWGLGPFQLIDALGVEHFVAKLEEEGRTIPQFLKNAAKVGGCYRVHQGQSQCLGVDGKFHNIPRADGVLLLEDIRCNLKPLLTNDSASLWNIGDGVTCFEIHTHMDTLDLQVMDLLEQSIELVSREYKALVIYNEGTHFSTGANLKFMLDLAENGDWNRIETVISAGQTAYLALKRSPFPVVAAPAGMALGGGCELMLHADAILAHVETYAGLVEVGVGLIPAWGGCTALLERFSNNTSLPKGPMPIINGAFETIGMAKVSSSAHDARDMGLLRPEDGITFNRDRLLADAKQKALDLVSNYRVPAETNLFLPGETAQVQLRLAVRGFQSRGLATNHDVVICDALAGILSGGETRDISDPLSEVDIHYLERQAFMELIKSEATQARMRHMLSTGKPLRN